MRSQFLKIPWGSWLLLLNIPQWGREFLIWTLKWMQKIENEEPVSGNSLGKLAPPTKLNIPQWGREFLIWTPKWMQKIENEEPVSGISLGELAPPNEKSQSS